MSKVYEAMRQAERQRSVASNSPSFPASEEMEVTKGQRHWMGPMMALYQAIGSALPGVDRKIIQFVASREGEGTSTIVREFARASARRMGKSVFIIDADGTRPILHHFFGVTAEYYLEDSIRNGGGSTEGIASEPGNSLSVGLLSRECTSLCELLDSRDTKGFFDDIRRLFDFVLIDSSSIATSPDCLSICSHVDGVVLVVEAENTRWPVVQTSKDRIINSGGNILGIVLNKRRFRIPGFIYRRI